jgi:hypothetical protein
VTDKPLLAGAFGARGVGKTQWLVRWLKARKAVRLAAWDFKHDPALDALGCRSFTSLPDLCRAMVAPRFKVRYLVDHEKDLKPQFDLFCRAIWLAGDLDAYIGELPTVTGPGRAPKSWQQCVNIGREYTRHDGKLVGLTIAADAQRFAEVDRSFTSNLDVIHCGRFGDEDDARAAAKKLGCEWPELMQLPDLAFIEKIHGPAACTRGVLSFRNTSKKSSPRP